MKEYTIIHAPSAVAAPRVPIDCYSWGGDYRPVAFASLADTGDALSVRLECHETQPLAHYTDPQDPVYRDSCLEFFVAADRGGKFINFETNSAGVMLSACGYAGVPREPLDPLPRVTAGREGEVWFVTYEISYRRLAELLGADIRDADCFYGNFYKCGDDTPAPHFGSWAPISLPAPQFHCPEFFGRLSFERGKRSGNE